MRVVSEPIRTGHVKHRSVLGVCACFESWWGPASLHSVSATHPDRRPTGDDWLHEIKFDGYRTELIIERDEARAFTRRGFDWTEKYRPIAGAAASLPAKAAIVDGEVVVLNDKGLSDFSTLKSAMRWQPSRLIFVAFDLLHLDG
jgi:ATP-dependent DNA ligase